MLVFALKYRDAIDDIAGNKTASLRRYELDDEEWKIAQQLCDTLKVRVCRSLNQARKLTECGNLDIQGRNSILFVRNTEPCHGYSSDGSY
jgi:hypothetical protein